MKTITKKTAKNGATLYYIDGKRASRADAMYWQRQNENERKYLARIEAEKTFSDAMSEVNTSADAIDAAVEAEIEIVNNAAEENADAKPTLTRSQLQKMIDGVIAEREEYFDALEEYEADDECPQMHIDYLHDMIEKLSNQYWELVKLYDNAPDDEPPANQPDEDDISDICKYKPDIEDDNNRLDWDDSAIGNTEDESGKIFTDPDAYNAAVEATFKEQHPSGWATLESVVYVNGIAYPESDFRKKVATDPIVHFGGKVYFESDLRKQQAKVATANQPVEVNDPLNDIELDELDGSENEPDEDCFALLPDIDELVDVDWIDDNETVNPDNPPTPELSITQKWAKEILDGLGSLIVKFGGAGKTKDGGLALHYNTFRNEHDEFGAPIFIVECFKPKDIFCNNPYRLDHVNVIKGYGDDKVVTTYYMPTDKGNRRIEININGESITFVDGKPNYIWSEKYHAGFSYYSSKFVANIYRDGKLFAHKLIHEDEEFFALMIERGACTIDTPPVNPPEPQDTLAAVAGTCAALNAAAPEGWEIFYDAEDKSFPIEFKGRQVTKLDSLATQKFLTPEKFFGQFKSLVDEDYSPYQEFVDSLYKERNALEEMREELVSDKDRFKTLTAMIAQIDRDIAAAELPF